MSEPKIITKSYVAIRNIEYEQDVWVGPFFDLQQAKNWIGLEGLSVYNPNEWIATATLVYEGMTTSTFSSESYPVRYEDPDCFIDRQRLIRNAKRARNRRRGSSTPYKAIDEMRKTLGDNRETTEQPSFCSRRWQKD